MGCAESELEGAEWGVYGLGGGQFEGFEVTGEFVRGEMEGKEERKVREDGSGSGSGVGKGMVGRSFRWFLYIADDDGRKWCLRP